MRLAMLTAVPVMWCFDPKCTIREGVRCAPLTCTALTPAPKGEPLYRGAQAAHWARRTWSHPEIEITPYAIMSITGDYARGVLRRCKHCQGEIP